jgi:hypothetical protein
LDSNFTIANSSDTTKQLLFNLGSISTGSAITFQFPSSQNISATLNFPFISISDTVVTNTCTATLTSKSLVDASNVIVNASDTTKRIAFSVGGNTTSTSLTIASNQTTSQSISVPNVSSGDSFVTNSTTATLHNKTLVATTLGDNITPGSAGTYSIGTTSLPLLTLFTDTLSGPTGSALTISTPASQNILLSPGGTGSVNISGPLLLAGGAASGNTNMNNWVVNTFTTTFTGPFTSSTLTLTFAALLNSGGHGFVIIMVPAFTGTSTASAVLTASAAIPVGYRPTNTAADGCRVENSSAIPTTPGMIVISWNYRNSIGFC